MKTRIRIILSAIAFLFAVTSCQEETETSGTKAGEEIQININASLGELVSSDEMRATAKSVVRLEWVEGDKVQAYCGTTKISTGDGLIVTPSENKMFASLTGTITAPAPGKTITFVYSSGCDASGLTFDFSNQTKTNGIPFVAYGTLVYDEKDISNKMVGFTFATSVMKIAATNLGGGTIDNAIVRSVNTKATLAPSESGEPAITGNTSGNISTNNFEASSDGTRAIVTVGLVPEDKNTNRKLSVTQGVTQTTDLTSAKVIGNTSYYTPCVFGSAVSYDYVTIGGLKWAKCNIGATTETGFGYYFAWGGTEGYVYRNGKWVKASDGSELSDGFGQSNAPFYTGSAYTKYTGNDGKNVLEPADDAATAYLGTGWRMPDKENFETLYNSCLNGDSPDKTTYATKYCNSTEKFTKGIYVCGNYDGVEGCLFVDDSGNKLFFPSAGYGDNKDLDDTGHGYYWSRTLNLSDPLKAYRFVFNPEVIPSVENNRYLGLPIRPVSDSQ
ncbi:MAG: hypothetical protein KBS65_05590 [Prevotella sp.]|nr:hypothetical protein [Candidatus Equicola stercoris]